MIKRRQPLEEAGESPLKKLRDELEMSQEEFARQIGTSVRTVSRP
jgi:putative transcriptional regulator